MSCLCVIQVPENITTRILEEQENMKTDMELRRDVTDELEPSVDAARIGVAAHDGVVMLTGNVNSYAQKLAAERIAKRVHGVKAIANDIEVHLPGTAERTDADIAQAAINAMNWSHSVPGGPIKVAVSKGWITLEGEVKWQHEKDAAFEAVHHLVGVKGVTNLVALKPRPSATDVKSRIEEAFRRSAELDAEAIQVNTRNGKVTLRGDVHSWSERAEAERTAKAAPGVTHVENLLALTP
jgi:osmotically-inducible protein OsmY